MSYIELNCRVFPADPASDILVAQLAEIGYESFAESDTGLLAYIQKEHFDPEKLDELSVVQSGMFDISFEYAEIEDENWNAVWESNYEPVLIDGKCFVRAPFHEPHPQAEYDIVVEPKMSFGTAHHETTYLTASLMLRLEFKDMRVLDMGSGTGILSILAAQKGAREIVAIDIDEWAYKNAVENVERNKLSNVKAIMGDASAIGGEPFDIIIANINRNILLEDMKAYSKALKSGGTILFSGFYQHDMDTVMQEAQKYQVAYQTHLEKNDWVAVTAKKL